MAKKSAKKDGFRKPTGATNYTSPADRKTPADSKSDARLTESHP